MMTMVTANSQTLTERQKAPIEREQSYAWIDSAEREVLQPRVKGLAACACLMAQGDMNRLETAVRMALDNGVTVNELKEAFSQLYAYTGFPRSLNALGVLNMVLESSPRGGLKGVWQEGKPWTRPAEWDDAKKAYELGTKNQTQLSGKPFNYEFCPQDDYYLKSHLFGDIFASDQLSAADREIVTVAALSGLEGVSEGYTLRSKWPKGEPNPYGKYFIGQSYLADVGGGVINVTFEPRCRNNWHIHHKAVQVLICVAGKGWYQEWGKEPQELTPGTVIAIPAEVKHWHGAQKDSWFQHLTYHKDVQEGASNEWCEAVSNEQYDALSK